MSAAIQNDCYGIIAPHINSVVLLSCQEIVKSDGALHCRSFHWQSHPHQL